MQAGRALGFDIVFEGGGLDERRIDRVTGRTVISVDPQFYRPSEVDLLLGDASKAERQLSWKRSTTFAELVHMMAEADLRRARDPDDSV